jgi:sRNA-binding protein
MCSSISKRDDKFITTDYLQQCRWPSLVTDGQPQLLAVNIREAMVNDIRQRGLEVSVKTLKRCLAAVTRSDAYLGAMTVGAWRKNLAGQPVAPVSERRRRMPWAQGSGAC